MRRSGSSSAGTLSSLSLERATSTPSAALKVIGYASSNVLNVGSMPRRPMVGSIIGTPYAARSLVQRITQRHEPAIEPGGGGGHHTGVAEVAVHHRHGVVHLHGHTGGGQ